MLPQNSAVGAPSNNIRHLRGVPGGGGGGRSSVGRHGSGGGSSGDDRIVFVTTEKRVPFAVFSVIPSGSHHRPR